MQAVIARCQPWTIVLKYHVLLASESDSVCYDEGWDVLINFNQQFLDLEKIN